MAKRAGLILRAGRGIANLMRSGEGRLIALLAGFGAREISNGWMQTRRARRQYRSEVARIAAGMQAEAEREARAWLTEAYGRRWEDVAEEIDASTQRRRWEDFAEEVSHFSERMDADLSEARRAAEDAARELMDEVNRQFLESLKHMRREMDDAYRQVIEAARDARNAQEQTVTQAVQDALTRFAMRGVVGFQDAAGRNWGLAEYSEMAMRTAVQRMSMISTMIGMLENGRDLCFVNAHDGACPVCKLWEGRLMSLTGATPGYPKLSDAMLAGLFHPNCAHILQVYDPETSDLTLGRSGITDAESAKLFRDSQRQRYIERQIRAHKRALAAAVTPDAQEKEKRDIAYWQKRARELVAENPRLTRRYDRESLRNYPAPAEPEAPEPPTPPALPPAPENLQGRQNSDIISVKRLKDEIRTRIRADTTNKTIIPELQNRHIRDSGSYESGKSYINGTLETAQTLVDKYHGTGDPSISKAGDWNHAEVVETEDFTGVAVDKQTSEETETRRFKIFYRKTGTHVVPVKPRREDT